MQRIIIAGALLLIALSALASDFPIGFVNHYPMVKHDDDRIAQTGANVLEVRAPWPFVEPEKGRFDFSLLDQQLRLAHENDLKLVYILEAGPAHAAGIPWLADILRSTGELMVDQQGNVVNDPSVFSTTYRKYLRRYLRKTVNYLANHPLRRVVYGYNNGCEWWYPLSHSYSPLNAAAFRKYLVEKYHTLDALNGRWGADFKNWEAIQPPRVAWRATGNVPQGCLVPEIAYFDGCYCTAADHHISVQPGDRLVFEAQYQTSDYRCGAVTLEIAWLKADDPKPIKISRSSKAHDDASGVRTAKLEAMAPPHAARAWLLLKSQGIGKVTFNSATCTGPDGNQLAPNPHLDPDKPGWQFILWQAGDPDAVSHGWDRPGDAWIEYQPQQIHDDSLRYPLAQLYDWMDLRARGVADLLEWIAAQIRTADPTRPIVTYLTFAFANPFEWDYAQQQAIYLDRIAKSSDHQQILGMQLASAEGDYDSVTCAFDMLRKYRKPMWAIDLLDFTSGVHLGRRGLTRTSMSVLQHGGDGIQYYCWFGTPHYNYAELGVSELRKMIGAVNEAAEKLAGAEPVCEVALVMPRMPLYEFLPEPANNWTDFVGWYKALVRLGVCPDVYTLEELPAADLSAYEAVIVPDCAYILRPALQTLSAARDTGIDIIASGRFANRDMSARPLDTPTDDIPTCRFENPVGANLLGDPYRKETISNTPSRLICRKPRLKWDAETASRIGDCLRTAGVTMPLHPGHAPVTATTFTNESGRLTFILPFTDWSGHVTCARRLCTVPPCGSLHRVE